MLCIQDYTLVPGGEHTAQAFQGLTFGGNDSGIGIGLGMLQQQQAAAQHQGFQPQVRLPPVQEQRRLMILLLCSTMSYQHSRACYACKACNQSGQQSSFQRGCQLN